MDFSVSLVHVTVCKCSLLTTGYFSLCFLKLILNFKKVPYRLLFSMIINHYQLQSLQLLYKVYKGKISVILVVNKIVLRYIIFVIIKFRNWPGNSPVGETFLLISLHVCLPCLPYRCIPSVCGQHSIQSAENRYRFLKY